MMLTDEEIEVRIKQAEVMGKVFHEMGGDEAGVRCEIELLQDLQATRQDFRSVCDILDKCGFPEMKKLLRKKYGWR